MSEYFRKYIKKEHYPVQPSNLRFKTSFKNCIYESLKRRTWKETDHETDWDIFWTEKEWIIEVMDHMHLAPHQKVNHYRNYYELCRKDNLIKNLKRYKKALEKEGKLDEAANFNFYPTTYNLPGEYSIFCEEFKRNSNNVWIMKPIGKSQGKGIFLFNKLSQVSQWKSETRWKPDAPQVDNYIVQRYINNPLLIGGKKFDMRIYCLVTSYSPLVAYLYRDGFARFTHHRYDSEDISNTYVHLTNVAIQKTSENYDEKLGGKWDLRTLKLYLMSKYGQEPVSECFANIQQVIIRSLQSVQKVMLNDKHCFELYGFDILLDDQLKPWLIEVNGSPSMTANTTHDFELKCNLLDDVFTIIDMEKILTGQEEQIGGFDLICKGTPIRAESSMFASMLSCHNNRAQQLKKLGKIISSKLAQVYLQEKEEAKRNMISKDNQSISTTDTTGTILGKGRTKALPNKTANTIIGSKPAKPPMLTKQNTISYAKEPRDSKEFKEVPASSIPTNSNTRLVKGRLSEVGKARTSLGLPPVNTSLGTNPNNVSANMYSMNNPSLLIPTNTTPGGINNPNNLQKTSSNLSNNAGLSPLQNTAANSLAGKPVFSQPSQQGQGDRFTQMVSNKIPSTLQLAGGASLKFEVSQSQTESLRTKGRSITNIQDILDTKQNVYTYSTNRPSSKAEDRNNGFLNNKGPDDIIDTIANKSRDNFRKAGLLSESDALTAEEALYLKRKDYPEELIQNSNYSDRDNYE